MHDDDDHFFRVKYPIRRDYVSTVYESQWSSKKTQVLKIRDDPHAYRNICLDPFSNRAVIPGTLGHYRLLLYSGSIAPDPELKSICRHSLECHDAVPMYDMLMISTRWNMYEHDDHVIDPFNGERLEKDNPLAVTYALMFSTAVAVINVRFDVDRRKYTHENDDSSSVRYLSAEWKTAVVEKNAELTKDYVIRGVEYTTGDMCLVCSSSRACDTMLPCAHVSTCSSCTSKCKRCPVCRCDFEYIVRRDEKAINHN